MAHDKYRELVRAGVLGHAVGDALGVPVEFCSRRELEKRPVWGMEEFGFWPVLTEIQSADVPTGITYCHLPAGTWSDDTSMEIALMQSLIDCGSFDFRNIMANFVRWMTNGDFTATGAVFDIGAICSQAISNYVLRGCDPLECGLSGVRDNGNGSLMRIVPVAYVCYRNCIVDAAKRYELVRNVSSLTHAHEISVLGCLICVNMVCCLLDGDNPAQAYWRAKKCDYSMFSESTRAEYRRVLEDDISKYLAGDIQSGGYVRDTLEASLWCLLNGEDYSDTVLAAVNLGDDADTVGAVTGSMAGIYYGYDAIPCKWLDALQRRDYLLELCDKFAETEITV